MRSKFRGRDYLGLKDFTKEEMTELIDLTQDLKRKWVMGEPHATCEIVLLG
ncbi:hypothetical protein [Listeria aquatica]|uniref:Ornithine carbamoyltransferase n=1 Tax=Listeria aquatica FSL S10-1188 TaxID=1265818 RepID=W7B561_9LIST|nr:hypothetical protein [Listeria aquatica]EUJ21062.1 ornithine carbamoyltransferase [Listeria aquatica FSL S10-1188]